MIRLLEWSWEAWVVPWGGWNGGGWNVSAFRTVAILVGDVVNGVDHAVRTGVRVGSLHDLGFSRGSWVLQEATLIGTDSVAGLIAVDVRAVWVGFVHLVQDHGTSFRATEWDWSNRKRANLSGGSSDDSNEYDHLQ